MKSAKCYRCKHEMKRKLLKMKWQKTSSYFWQCTNQKCKIQYPYYKEDEALLK